MAIPINQIAPLIPYEAFKCPLGNVFMRDPVKLIIRGGKTCHVFERTFLHVDQIETGSSKCPICRKKSYGTIDETELKVQIANYLAEHPELDDIQNYREEIEKSRKTIIEINSEKKRKVYLMMGVIVLVVCGIAGGIIGVSNH